MLQARELTCERGERTLFEGLAIALNAGECLHITGRNGAGKTNLLRILAGLLAPTHGTVLWNGRDIRGTREEYGAALVYIGHLNGIKEDMTAAENLRFAAALRGADSGEAPAQEALACLGLPDIGDMPVRHLSQGQRRRVALARLCQSSGAPLWILDEPFNALDTAAIESLSGIVATHLAAGGMVALTAHHAVHLPGIALRSLELAGGAA